MFIKKHYHSVSLTVIVAFYCSLVSPITVASTEAASEKVIMSHFKNKDGLLIRTYASEVAKPNGFIILVHGNRVHFMADFCSYNLKWYMENYGHSPIDSAILMNEVQTMYSMSGSAEERADYEFHHSKLDGKNALDVSPRYILKDSLVQLLNNSGYSVYGLDLQSHGRSAGYGGKRAFFNEFDDLVLDVIQFVDIVKRGKFHDSEEKWDEETFGKGYKPGSYILMGHSMGGNIVLRAAQIFAKNYNTYGNLANGIVCFGPMLNIDHHFFGYPGVIAPFLRIGGYFDVTFPEHYPVDYMDYFLHLNDPYACNDYPYVKVIAEQYKATRTIKENYKYYPKEIYTLVFHSEDDDMCLFQGSKDLVDKHLKHINSIRLIPIKGRAHNVAVPPMVEEIPNSLQEWLSLVS